VQMWLHKLGVLAYNGMIVSDELSRVVRLEPLFGGLADDERGTRAFYGGLEAATALVSRLL